MTARIRDIDRGARRLTQATERLARGVRATVGIHPDTGAQPHGDSGLTVAGVAAIAEYGTEHQPPRSFLRATVDAEEARIERELAGAAESVARGRATPEHAFGAITERVAGAMRSRMTQTTPNDPATVEAKGSSTPLEATGQLKAAIEGRVEVGR